jgi:predicted phage terminase large subunit-like protein
VRDKENNLYITDVLYTQDGQEVTEPTGAAMLIKNTIESAWIESNAGGRSYARNIQAIIEAAKARVTVRWFAQTKNKEARILTNSAGIRQKVFMPRGWRQKWPEFARHLLEFRKNFRANTHDDAPDALTGLYEKSFTSVSILI